MNEGKDRAQLDKFKDLAREIEADENEVAFDEKLRRISRSTDRKPDSRETG